MNNAPTTTVPASAVTGLAFDDADSGSSAVTATFTTSTGVMQRGGSIGGGTIGA